MKTHYQCEMERYTSGTTPTAYRFTGQREESGIGLYFYNARWYDAAPGRFASADIIVPSQQSDDSKHIQMWLIVDYHELNLLTPLGEMYRDDLQNTNDDPKQEEGAGHSYFNPTINNRQERDNHEDFGSSDNIYQPLVDFNQQSNLGREQNSGSRDEGRKNNNDLASKMPTYINSTAFDRYAYTSNCPTKYTDPSGHCDFGKALGGGLLMIGGGIVGAVGVIVFSTGSAAIIALQIEGLGGVAIGGIIGFIGLGITGFGGYLLYQSDCIPGLSP